MKRFGPIEKRAAKRHGGQAALEAKLPRPKTARALAKVGDDRFLSRMAHGVFQAGFSWKVVEAKWPGFEEVFHGFDPQTITQLSRKQWDLIAKDTRIIRNPQKIRSVEDNAQYVVQTALTHGSFAKFIASWPDDDVVGLLAHLKKHGARLGGNTGPYFLRSMGKDTFILARDVVKALVEAGVVDKTPTGKGALQKTQEAFIQWKQETGRPFCQLSRILAMSTD